MRAIPLERTGPSSVLRVKELPDPAPGPGEVVVRVRAIGVNYAEVLSRKGLYGWAPKKPYVPGMEATGVVERVGDGVPASRVGEEVIVGAQSGCYAERVRVAAHQALPAIEGLSTEENAAFAVNYLTAWTALFEMARLRPTDFVLVTAAGGGVGTAALQLASAYGCRVIGAASSAEKAEAIGRAGASRAITYDDLARKVREATGGGGPDVVIEMLGGETYRAALRSLAPLGRLVVVGFAGLAELNRWSPVSWWRTWRAIPRADVMKMLTRSHSIGSTHIGYLLAEREILGRLWRDVVAFTQKHGIRPVVGARFPFERMPDAHALIESRRSVGKVVVTVG